MALVRTERRLEELDLALEETKKRDIPSTPQRNLEEAFEQELRTHEVLWARLSIDG